MNSIGKMIPIDESIISREKRVTVLFGLVVVVILLSVSLLGWLSVYFYILSLVSIILILFDIFIFIPLKFRRLELRVSPKNIYFKRGICITTIDVIPIKNISYIRTSTSPLDSRWSHKKLTVKCSSLEMQLPRLHESQANWLIDFVDNE